jgi:undecaprenyldiphospho-muramoylpentapeptide beta-N-acetylglucosaminyltransferase
VLWVGTEGGIEEDMVKRENIAFETIPAAGIHGIRIKSLPGNILRLARGYFASRRILKSFKPDVLLFTGGYVAVPMALAGIPLQSLLYVPDIEPGLALKTLARFSDQIALTTPESKTYFSGHRNTRVTGYPTRVTFSEWTREKAEQLFNLSKEKPVVLIFGGSKGARSINQVVEKHLDELLGIAQVIHISGQSDFAVAEQSREKLTNDMRANYHLYPYLHNMGAALSAADLAISRAGASTLGEYPLFGLPAILVPYPYAWRYQKGNADYLSSHGAALVLEDSRLGDDLVPLVKSTLADPQKLSQMRNAMTSLAVPSAAERIAEMLVDLSTKKTGRIQP